jgi:hypothetical protein
LWRERADYGHFFYRIPNGESGADVYDRITSFNGSLWRRFSEDDMASVAVLVTHGLCSRVFLMAWYHYSVEFFEDLRNINHCEFLVMKLGDNGRYVLQNKLRRWTDLKRERAARRSISAPSANVAESVIPNIPVRRWVSKRSANEGAPGPLTKRPVRQNTADLFKDDEEVDQKEEDIENRAGAEYPAEGESARAKASSKNDANAAGWTYGSFRQAPSPLQQTTPSQREVIKAYLGRDGGGSKSGAASPHAGSDDENGTDTPASVQRFEPRSLAMALKGEFDDPNRVLADALGDQSDAEVDEADKEVGTKAREESEMEKILEEERRERSRRGSAA